MTTTPVLPDALRTAAHIIGERGWTQRATIDPTTGGVCASGALRLAFGQAVSNTGGLTDDKPTLYSMYAPSSWQRDDYGKFRDSMNAAAGAIDGYLHDVRGYGDGPRGAFYLPHFVTFNDSVAETAEQVQQLLRDTADWIETGVETGVNSAFPATDPSIPNENLVLA